MAAAGSIRPYTVRSQYFALADELSNIGLLYMGPTGHADYPTLS